MTPALFDPCCDDGFDRFMSSVFVYGNDLYDLDGEIILRRSQDGRIETFGDNWFDDETRSEGGQP